MKWHLLNQLCVSLGPLNLDDSVLEEVVSSELQLVTLLASVMDYLRITSSDYQESYNQVDLVRELHS